jgi:putative oxidoreductase
MYPAAWGFMAALTEFAGGILFILGFMFRPASILLTFLMAMAVVHHLHAGDAFRVYAHALSLGIVFLGLSFIGPGKLSIDGI